jgi:hypothetical protein
LQKKPAKVQIISLENIFDFGDVQILLSNNHFFSMKDPILFVSGSLGIELPQLVHNNICRFPLVPGHYFGGRAQAYSQPPQFTLILRPMVVVNFVHAIPTP